MLCGSLDGKGVRGRTDTCMDTYISIHIWLKGCLRFSFQAVEGEVGMPRSTTEKTVCMCPVTQSCLTLCDCIDCRLPGSSVHGILQARTPE